MSAPPRVPRARAWALAAVAAAVLIAVVLLGAIGALRGAAAGVGDAVGHAVAGDASPAPRASGVMQNEANAPGFRLRVKHRLSVVAAGGIARYVVHLRRMYGFGYPVRLTVFDLPSGASAVITPRLAGADAIAQLEIRTGAASPAGQHLFRVLAASHGVSTTAESTITIRPP